MSSVVVQRIEETDHRTIPVFEDLDRLLDKVQQRAYELFEQRGATLGRELDDWLTAERETLGCPAAEVADCGKDYQIQIALAGYDPGEIEVAVTPREILVHAEHRDQAGQLTAEPEQERRILWSELSPGSSNIYRDFELPQEVDIEHVAAELNKGLLTITAPKACA
jgi:HSP20 family molecular chaperone IbpA